MLWQSQPTCPTPRGTRLWSAETLCPATPREVTRLTGAARIGREGHPVANCSDSALSHVKHRTESVFNFVPEESFESPEGVGGGLVQRRNPAAVTLAITHQPEKMLTKTLTPRLRGWARAPATSATIPLQLLLRHCPDTSVCRAALPQTRVPHGTWPPELCAGPGLEEPEPSPTLLRRLRRGTGGLATAPPLPIPHFPTSSPSRDFLG